MRTWNKWRHIGNDLPAFHDGALPRDRMQRASEHLKTCDRCRQEYEDTHFAASMARQLEIEEAPHDLWKAIVEAYWEDKIAAGCPAAITPGTIRWWRGWPRLVLGPKFRLEIAAAGAVCLLCLSGVLVWRLGRATAQHRSSPPAGTLTSKTGVASVNEARTPEPSPAVSSQFDLAAYIEPVKASANDRCVQAISKAAPRFVIADKQDAFRAAGLGGVLSGEEPLPGYRLVAYRVCEAGADRLAQLVYSHGDDAFCVFVAPRDLKLLTGREAALETQVNGIHCQKVDCPQQETYLFGAGRFHCVLVSKSLNQGQAAAVMRYFISAHRQQGQG